MRRGLTTFGENTTATHCGDCPHAEPFRHHWCDHFGAVHLGQRAPACLDSERAFNDAVRVAKIEALQSMRRGMYYAADRAEIDAEIKRLESEGR